jgi:uncharacterized protein YkwD
LRTPPRSVRSLRSYVFCLLALFNATAAFAAKPSTSETASNDTDSAIPFTRQQFAAALLAETNRVRREHRLPPLEPLSELNAAADDQAWYIALRFQVQHTSDMRDQSTPMDRVHRHGVQPQSCFENAASIPAQNGEKMLSGPEVAAALVAAWLASPGHRANLLNSEVTHFGGAVRIVHTPTKVLYAYGIQIFVRMGSARQEIL